MWDITFKGMFQTFLLGHAFQWKELLHWKPTGQIIKFEKGVYFPVVVYQYRVIRTDTLCPISFLMGISYRMTPATPTGLMWIKKT